MNRAEQTTERTAEQTAPDLRVQTLDTGRGDTGGAAPPDSEFPGEAEFKAAIAHFGFSAGRIGAPAEYKTPFTRQLKSDTALRFEIDKAHFEKANQVEGEVIRSYLWLRLSTFVLFGLTLFAQATIFEAAFRNEIPAGTPLHIRLAHGAINASPELAGAAAALFLLIVTAVAFGLRISIRSIWFHELSRNAQQLSFEIFRHLHEINTRVTEVCAKVRDRVGRGGEWPVRARKWTTIALWNAKRGEYLDRFVTTVIWKVRTSIQQIEVVFLIMKMALATGVGALALHDRPGVYSVFFFLFLLGQTFLLWHWWGRQPSDFWTTQFRKSAPAGDSESEAYVDKIGGVVENLVHEALSKEFGQGGGSAKKP